MYNKESTRLLWFCGGGEGSGHAFCKFYIRHIRRPIQQDNI